MRDMARGVRTPMPPHETLLTASSRTNSEALAACVVLAHPCVAFHPCTCGLRRGVVVVAAPLIGYEKETIMNYYFLYTDSQLRWIIVLTLLSLLSASSGNDP
jgi:hypothetical protein